MIAYAASSPFLHSASWLRKRLLSKDMKTTKFLKLRIILCCGWQTSQIIVLICSVIDSNHVIVFEIQKYITGIYTFEIHSLCHMIPSKRSSDSAKLDCAALNFHLFHMNLIYSLSLVDCSKISTGIKSDDNNPFSIA